MPTLVYPTWQELTEIDRDLVARTTADSPIFDLFPIVTTDSNYVTWEQQDVVLGLMQVRGFNSPNPSVPRLGAKRYTMQPSAYGEFTVIDELEMTARAAVGRYDVPINITDLVRDAQDQLLSRQINRVEWILWTLLTTGTFTVLDVKGTVVATDAYTPQKLTAGVTWATVATATPLGNLRAVQLLSRGHSISFGTDATAFMNRATWNDMISNTNAADLGGRKGAGLQSIQSLGEVNELLTRDGLPNIVIYDEGYLDDNGAFQLWIPNNRVVVVGKRRNGATIGNFSYTRNASNADFGGRPVVKIVDHGAAIDEPPPRRIEVHRGFNGGPKLFYGNAVVIMTV